MSRYFDLFARLDGERNSTRAGWMNASPWRAEVEKFVTRLYLLPESPLPQVVVFVGSEPGDGWRWLYPYSSDLLASWVGSSVCLVEANPGVPSLLERLGLPKRRGLADLLADTGLELNHVVAKIPGGESWLLTCGEGFRSSGQSLLCNERLPDRLSQLRARFEFVLIDTPPISDSRSALAVAPLADGVVLVLEADRTRRRHVRRLTEDLEAAGATVLGAIVAGSCAFPISK